MHGKLVPSLGSHNNIPEEEPSTDFNSDKEEEDFPQSD